MYFGPVVVNGYMLYITLAVSDSYPFDRCGPDQLLHCCGHAVYVKTSTGQMLLNQLYFILSVAKILAVSK